jgi:hypothetical protein
MRQNAQPKQRAQVGLSPEAIADRVRTASAVEPSFV